MSSIERTDDFESRRRHLQGLTDEELHARFWQLAQSVVDPLLAEARSHTSPSIERSVLLRMGFSSIEAGELVQQMNKRGLLGHGAGRQVLELATAMNMPVRDAGLALLTGKHWRELPL